MRIIFLILSITTIFLMLSSCDGSSTSKDEHILRAEKAIAKGKEITALQKEKLANLPDSLELDKFKIDNNIRLTEFNVTRMEELLNEYLLKKSEKNADMTDVRVELITQMEYLESLIDTGLSIVSDKGINIGRWAEDPAPIRDSIAKPRLSEIKK